MRKHKFCLKKSKFWIMPVALAVAVMLAGMLLIPGTAYARYEESEHGTGYEVIIEDDAELLSEAEEEALLTVMQEISAYGNVAFKSIDENSSSTRNYIENYYFDKFIGASGTVFLIDMDNRNIWIHSDGAIYQRVTTAYANVITDNVYTYATDAEYYECAYRAFDQILTLLKGEKIAQPMKYISNALLAVILALLINYFIVKLLSGTSEADEKELLAATRNGYKFTNPEAIHTHTTKKYDPPSSSSGGGGRSGGGGGGGGGGGHSF